jgi:ABC-type microcin C transport system permease subunit YejE
MDWVELSAYLSVAFMVVMMVYLAIKVRNLMNNKK